MNHHLSIPVCGRDVEWEMSYHHTTWQGPMRLYEPEVVNAMGCFVRPGDFAIDAGANLGFFSCLLSRLVGPDGLVMALEPGSAAFERLAENIVLNGMNNVACVRKGLYSHDGMAKLHLVEQEGATQLGYSSLFHYEGQGDQHEVVEVRALDTLLVGEHPRLIKLDVEGVEEEALRGAEQVLRRGVDCVVAELNYAILTGSGRSDRPLREFMASLGYDMFLINFTDPDTGRYYPPIRVLPGVTLELRGPPDRSVAINVMFSTQDKVDAAWR